uniref:RWP-RK domain-containing protein n=2 Tax=Opuntia streptacantha TaxID=393608 RepID=A0A7C9ABT2_OPUST
MSSVQNQKSNTDLALSFEDVSKLFSLPLSEAADILGISTSALKKLCNENGLERWPHRKYLAGKSIEEIKKEAAKEKSKFSGGTSPADRQKNNVMVGSAASPSPGSQVKDKTPKSAPEMSKSQSNAQQPGSKNIYALRPPHVLASGLAIETSTCLDEFKFGFPSNGLSRSTCKWWGNASSDQDKVPKDDLKPSPEGKPDSEAQAVDAAVTVCAEKGDSLMGHSGSDVQDKFSLSRIRKRAVDEGRKALKLGVLKRYRADKLGEEEKILFRRLFQTSFPMDGSAVLLFDANKAGNVDV